MRRRGRLTPYTVLSPAVRQAHCKQPELFPCDPQQSLSPHRADTLLACCSRAHSRLSEHPKAALLQARGRSEIFSKIPYTFLSLATLVSAGASLRIREYGTGLLFFSTVKYVVRSFSNIPTQPR